MKVGDKIYCIKTRGIGRIINKYHKWYKITEIHDNIISVNCESNSYDFNSHYSLIGDPQNVYLFKEYFLTENDIRKQKINKINKFTLPS